MNAPQARLWTELLLFRTSAARRPQHLSRSFSSLQPVARSSLPRTVLRHKPPSLNFRTVRLRSDKPTQSPNPTPHLGSPEPAPSLSQRLKRLSKEYGWLAVGVYFSLSVLDFPFCFLVVRMLGTERVGYYEHVIIEGVKNVIRIPFPSLFPETEAAGGPIAEALKEATAQEEALGHDGAQALGQNGDGGACKRPPKPPRTCCRNLLTSARSHLDPARPRIRCSQVIHLHPDTFDSSCTSQGRKNVPSLGVELWETKAKVTHWAPVSAYHRRIIRSILDSCSFCAAFETLRVSTYHTHVV